jgi:hypothetical protein
MSVAAPTKVFKDGPCFALDSKDEDGFGMACAAAFERVRYLYKSSSASSSASSILFPQPHILSFKTENKAAPVHERAFLRRAESRDCLPMSVDQKLT